MRERAIEQVEDAFEAGVRAQQERELTECGAVAGAISEESIAESTALHDTKSTSSGDSSESEAEGDSEEENGEGPGPSAKGADSSNGNRKPTKRQKMDYTAEMIFDYYTEKLISDVAESVIGSASGGQKASGSSEVSSIPPTTTDQPNGSANGGMAKREKNAKKPPAEPVDYPPVNLESFNSAEELEKLGLDHLKHALEGKGSEAAYC